MGVIGVSIAGDDLTLTNGGGSPDALWRVVACPCALHKGVAGTGVHGTMRDCDAIRALGIKIRNGTFGGDLHEALRPGSQRAAEIPGNRGIRPYPRGNIEAGKEGRQVNLDPWGSNSRSTTAATPPPTRS